jgi:dipeptidyl-peptidase-4
MHAAVLRVFVLLILVDVGAIAQRQPKELTLEDIFTSSKFATKTLNGIHWMKDGKHYSFYEQDSATKSTNIYLFSAIEKSSTLFLNTASLKIIENDPTFRFTGYQWSPDEKQILLITAPPERQYLSRLTPAGNIFLYDLTTKVFRQLTNVNEPQYNVKYSPDGKFLGFVRLNNIYVIDVATGVERSLTADGTQHIINGRFDWVYEEEFGISDGWQWSPDGKRIAFWSFDENRVPEYTLTQWDSLYLQLIPMRYPKPGEKNSIVKIGVVDVQTNATRWMDIGANDDIYIPRIQWTRDNNTLSIQRLNRAQNVLELLYAEVSTGATRAVLREEEEKWLEIHDALTFLDDGKFIWLSERDGFRHFYLYKNDGTLVNQITKGEWETDAYYGVDQKSNMLYYSSTEATPLDRQIYKIRLDGKKKVQLTAKSGTHAAGFSPTYEYFLDTFSDASTPSTISLLENDGEFVALIQDNSVPALHDYPLGKADFLTFTTTDSVSLNASMLKPVDFDSTKKYAVFMFAYGGPGSQVVRNIWGRTTDRLWSSLLNRKGYLIFVIDNRGTGARGKKFGQLGYRHLGKWEVNDHIEAAKYLATLPYVDNSRIGIWGWSYGGYTSSMVILKGSDYFKAAIAVAPVTNWKFYDNIYTERYMGTPQNNPDGYKESSPITYASKLKGKFLIIHGTSDDNVHFQNTANFVAALEKANKQFSTMFYPGKNHSIAGGNTRLHLYTLMTNFLLANL